MVQYVTSEEEEEIKLNTEIINIWTFLGRINPVYILTTHYMRILVLSCHLLLCVPLRFNQNYECPVPLF